MEITHFHQPNAGRKIFSLDDHVAVVVLERFDLHAQPIDRAATGNACAPQQPRFRRRAVVKFNNLNASA